MSRCSACGATVDGVALCARCVGQLRAALLSLPDALENLWVTVSRQSCLAAGLGVTRSGGWVLPFVPSAAALAAEVVGRVREWADVLWRVGVGNSRPREVGPLVAWLAHHVDAWAVHERGAQVCAEVARLLSAMARACDRRDGDVFLGRCDATDVKCDLDGDTVRIRVGVCGTDLFMVTGDRRVQCEACGARYAVEGRREALLAAAADVLARPSVISDALTRLDSPVTAATIRSWAARGRLSARGVDADARALYRVGDVAELVATRRQDR